KRRPDDRRQDEGNQQDGHPKRTPFTSPCREKPRKDVRRECVNPEMRGMMMLDKLYDNSRGPRAVENARVTGPDVLAQSPNRGSSEHAFPNLRRCPDADRVRLGSVIAGRADARAIQGDPAGRPEKPAGGHLDENSAEHPEGAAARPFQEHTAG